MTFLIVIFTALLILDCLLLALLVLVQLPKKDAGVGMAFGGGAADALFGAGSGTALSNLTKYTATAFFVLVFLLSILFNHSQNANVSALQKQMQKQTVAPITPRPNTPANSSSSTGTSNGLVGLSITNSGPVIVTPTTNTPIAPPK